LKGKNSSFCDTWAPPNRSKAAVREKTRQPAQQTATRPTFPLHARRVDSWVFNWPATLAV